MLLSLIILGAISIHHCARPEDTNELKNDLSRFVDEIPTKQRVKQILEDNLACGMYVNKYEIGMSLSIKCWKSSFKFWLFETTFNRLNTNSRIASIKNEERDMKCVSHLKIDGIKLKNDFRMISRAGKSDITYDRYYLLGYSLQFSGFEYAWAKNDDATILLYNQCTCDDSNDTMEMIIRKFSQYIFKLTVLTPATEKWIAPLMHVRPVSNVLFGRNNLKTIFISQAKPIRTDAVQNNETIYCTENIDCIPLDPNGEDKELVQDITGILTRMRWLRPENDIHLLAKFDKWIQRNYIDPVNFTLEESSSLTSLYTIRELQTILPKLNPKEYIEKFLDLNDPLTDDTKVLVYNMPGLKSLEMALSIFENENSVDIQILKDYVGIKTYKQYSDLTRVCTKLVQYYFPKMTLKLLLKKNPNLKDLLIDRIDAISKIFIGLLSEENEELVFTQWELNNVKSKIFSIKSILHCAFYAPNKYVYNEILAVNLLYLQENRHKEELKNVFSHPKSCLFYLALTNPFLDEGNSSGNVTEFIEYLIAILETNMSEESKQAKVDKLLFDMFLETFQNTLRMQTEQSKQSLLNLIQLATEEFKNLHSNE